MLTLLAPAKLNLTLEVLAKRQDGFHEISSVVQTIRLYDTLRFQLSNNIEFKCDNPYWIAEESLVSRAVSRLQEFAGYSSGVVIEVDKHIPLVSGLGGDSSDAATALIGLNQLWELSLSRDELLGLAAQLGSDIPFFFYGGTALLQGRGEIVTPLSPLPNMWVVLVVPDVPRLCKKTKQLYDRLRPVYYTDGRVTQKLVLQLEEGKDFNSSLLFNTFENVAFAPRSELGIYQRCIIKLGATDIHLAGSGPSLFFLIKDKKRAEELYARLQKLKMTSYLIDTQTAVDYYG